MKIDFARNLAIKALYRIDEDKSYSNIVLDEILNSNRDKLTNTDIGFISELVYGVTTWKLTLDSIIQKYSNIKLKKISSIVKNILRIGAYQIIFLDKIPKSAAVNESVNLCKKYSIKSAGFVNAILRKVEKEDLEELSKIENTVERISKTTSMPEWFVNVLINELGENKAEEICKNSNIKPKMSIRVNNLKTNKENLIKKLEDKDIKFESGKLDDFIYLNSVKNVTNLKLYSDGLFSMQDEAAALTALVLSPKEEEKILDCCSAPGGKTTYLAELMHNKGTITAWDLYENRLKLVDENAKRLGINIISTEVNDSTKLKEEYIEKFDKVLLDVPCLGLGVIRRKPDIKWQREEKDIQDISKTQIEILKTCSKYVKKGGTLLYSTCSILKEENENIIEKFLEENGEYEIVNPDNDKLKNFRNNIINNKYINLYTNANNDGFFICLLERKN